MSAALDQALMATPCMDADHPAVKAKAAELIEGLTSVREQAVALYGHVRDAYRYDPYQIDLSVAGMRASTVMDKGRGWCIPKAALLAALCRSVGIPARVGLADVKNHMATPRLIASMGTDVFYRHGYTAIWIDGQWLKATPAFNIELCHKMRIHALDFDGRTDSIYHPYDLDGQRHMEYLAQYGEFDELPLADIRAVFQAHYPGLMKLQAASWDEDVNQMAQDLAKDGELPPGNARP
ncbi:MAG: hypothetical protein RL111_1215 [Pseudomonadota bacterium]|jgi:transglutaminase-like putative cysteine protease